MSFCSKCGAPTDANQQFCQRCGAVIPQTNQNTASTAPGYTHTAAPVQNPYAQQPYPNNALQNPYTAVNPFNMGWYKFIIYFALFASAVYNIIQGLLLVMGQFWEWVTEYDVTSELMYACYGGLQAVDIIFGIITLAAAGFAIFTRMRLAKYKKDGPLCLYILSGVVIGADLIYLAVVSLGFGIPVFNASFAGSMGAGIGTLIANIIYFNKRKSLFVY